MLKILRGSNQFYVELLLLRKIRTSGTASIAGVDAFGTGVCGSSRLKPVLDHSVFGHCGYRIRTGIAKGQVCPVLGRGWGITDWEHFQSEQQYSLLSRSQQLCRDGQSNCRSVIVQTQLMREFCLF